MNRRHEDFPMNNKRQKLPPVQSILRSILRGWLPVFEGVPPRFKGAFVMHDEGIPPWFEAWDTIRRYNNGRYYGGEFPSDYM